jgi:hypothetical protein
MVGVYNMGFPYTNNLAKFGYKLNMKNKFKKI